MVWSAGEARKGAPLSVRVRAGCDGDGTASGENLLCGELYRGRDFGVTISFGDLCDAAVQFTVSTKEVYRINNRVVSRVQHDDEQCEFDVFVTCWLLNIPPVPCFSAVTITVRWAPWFARRGCSQDEPTHRPGSCRVGAHA